jgi:hypothetical protein
VIEEETTRGFDFDALREAIERKDPDLLLSFYAEDSELRIVNAAHPDGPAFELKGRSQIERYLRAVCDQVMTCLLEGEVISCEERITFGQRCTYPDSTRVVVKTTLEIVEGGIVRQTDVAHSTRREGTGEGVSTRSFRDT